MLLIVDDRFVDPRLTSIKEHLMAKVFGRVLETMAGGTDLKILVFTETGLHIMWDKDGEPHDRMPMDPSEGLLRLMDADEDEDCILMNRIAFFSEGLIDPMRYHKDKGNDVTVLVKELPAMPGMHGVSMDPDSNINYRKRDDPVRAKSMDLNIYILRKGLMIDLLHDEIDIKGLEVRSLPLHHEGLNMRGFRIRSKIGSTDDLVSILETQRMIMDTYLTNIQKETSNNLPIISDLILNMPVFAAGSTNMGSKCRIGPYATILNDVRIGDNVFIINSIICERCVIEDDAYIEGSIIGPDVDVEKGSEIEWSIERDRSIP